MTENTLSLGQQANFHAAVLKALPRDITPQAALRWERNGAKLAEALASALCPLATPAMPQSDIIIDCDADPFVPDGWKVVEHVKGGQVQWEPSKVSLWLASGQQNGGYVVGNKLRKEVAKKSPFNANVLDYLLANPHLIPEEWKGKYVFFWGTIYRDRGEVLYVRYLYWYDGRWDWSSYWLGLDFIGDFPAALPAS